jgi:oligoribonuclease NrnB/cAMP/cGMP phosphodiesterase (DHH superfamily)
MKIIPRDSKVLNIVHSDLDGSVSAIVLSYIFENITILDTSFYKVDSILETLDYSKYDYVILADIHPDKQQNLYLSNKIIMLDHHESSLEYNDPSKMHFIVAGICGALLTKRFVEKMYNIKLSHLDELVRLTNDYDMWSLKDPKSKELNDLMFYRYRPVKFRELFFDGRTEFTEDEKDWLKLREVEFVKLYDSLEVFEFEKMKGCITVAKEFINEICEKLMNDEGYNIVIVRNPRNGRVSVRNRNKNLDVGLILKEYGIGGGHKASAGFFSSDMNDFKDKIQYLEKRFEKELGL